jgi:Fe-S cluster biosynthesis and repair protein YggX
LSDAFRCARCLSEGPRLPAAPYPGPEGERIHSSVCANCWAEWEKHEVMVINELRLNFMDPEAQLTLSRAMREFLALDEKPA